MRPGETITSRWWNDKKQRDPVCSQCLRFVHSVALPCPTHYTSFYFYGLCFPFLKGEPQEWGRESMKLSGVVVCPSSFHLVPSEMFCCHHHTLSYQDLPFKKRKIGGVFILVLLAHVDNLVDFGKCMTKVIASKTHRYTILFSFNLFKFGLSNITIHTSSSIQKSVFLLPPYMKAKLDVILD